MLLMLFFSPFSYYIIFSLLEIVYWVSSDEAYVIRNWGKEEEENSFMKEGMVFEVRHNVNHGIHVAIEWRIIV